MLSISLRMKFRVFTSVHIIWDLVTFDFSLLILYPNPHSVLSVLSFSSLFLKHAHHSPTSGPLHLLFPTSRTLFSQISSWLSHFLHVCLHIITPKKILPSPSYFKQNQLHHSAYLADIFLQSTWHKLTYLCLIILLFLEYKFQECKDFVLFCYILSTKITTPGT